MEQDCNFNKFKFVERKYIWQLNGNGFSAVSVKNTVL